MAKRLVGFRRDRTKAHRARAEALDNMLGFFDLFDRHGGSRRILLELEQPA